MPHGRGIRAYMDVFTACLRQWTPIHVSDGINIASSRQCKGCRQLSKVNGTAVNFALRSKSFFTTEVTVKHFDFFRFKTTTAQSFFDCLRRLLFLLHAAMLMLYHPGHLTYSVYETHQFQNLQCFRYLYLLFESQD